MGSTASFWKSSRAPLLCLQLNWSPTTGSGIRYLSQSRLLSSAVVCCRSSGSAGCVCGPLACMFCFSAIVLLYFQKTRSYYFVGCMWRSEATSGAGSFLPPRGPRVGTELRCQAASVLPTVSLALLKIFLIVLRKSLSLSLKLRHDFRDCSNSIPLPQPL